MSSINKVILVGNIGNVDVKELNNGNKLVIASLATSESYKKDDEWVENTEWHRCVFTIPGLSERASSLNKGDKVYLEGKIKTNSWETKEGEKRESKEVSITSLQVFSRSQKTESPTTSKKQEVVNDDLPF